jgi:hypothetical protein
MDKDLRRSHVRALRLRAEELRATADDMQNPLARASFQRMAANFDGLAARYEASLTITPGKKTETR